MHIPFPTLETSPGRGKKRAPRAEPGSVHLKGGRKKKKVIVQSVLTYYYPSIFYYELILRAVNRLEKEITLLAGRKAKQQLFHHC